MQNSIHLSNAAYEIQCKLGVLIDQVQEWAYVFWVRPAHGRPYFVSKKSDIGLFIEANREYAPNQEQKSTTEAPQSTTKIKWVAPDFLVTMGGAAEGTIFLAKTHRTGLCLFFKLAYENRKLNGRIGGSWNHTFKCWERPVKGESLKEAIIAVTSVLESAGITPMIYAPAN